MCSSTVAWFAGSFLSSRVGSYTGGKSFLINSKAARHWSPPACALRTRTDRNGQTITFLIKSCAAKGIGKTFPLPVLLLNLCMPESYCAASGWDGWLRMVTKVVSWGLEFLRSVYCPQLRSGWTNGLWILSLVIRERICPCPLPLMIFMLCLYLAKDEKWLHTLLFSSLPNNKPNNNLHLIQLLACLWPWLQR